MTTITLVMEMSCDDARATVVTALQAMPDVSIDASAWTAHHQIVVAIRTMDPDVVDIVREIIWEFDPLATQHSVALHRAS